MGFHPANFGLSKPSVRSRHMTEDRLQHHFIQRSGRNNKPHYTEMLSQSSKLHLERSIINRTTCQQQMLFVTFCAVFSLRQFGNVLRTFQFMPEKINKKIKPVNICQYTNCDASTEWAKSLYPAINCTQSVHCVLIYVHFISS